MPSSDPRAGSRDRPHAPGPVAADVIIPAYQEAPNVGRVVQVALAAGLGRVLVIDDGSTDGTTAAARAAGAEVLSLPSNRGKGGALVAGANACTREVVVMLDADLVGLRPEHVVALAEPVCGGWADMARGTFEGGRWRTTAAQHVAPQLNGQRAVRRELLLAVPDLEGSRYGVEVAITLYAAAEGWRCVSVPLEGVSQVMKEEKLGFWRGLRVRLAMYGDIVATLLRARRSAKPGTRTAAHDRARGEEVERK